MKLQDLFEMPQLIGEVDFNLDERSNNRKVCISLSSNSKVMFNYQNVVVKKSGKYVYAERDDGLMPYLIETERKKISAVGREAMIQRGLWRDSAISAVAGLPSKVFFEYLLDQTGLIASDRRQSPDGQRFWILRISEALDKGLFVYLLNATGPRELTRVHNRVQLDAMHGEIWGTTHNFQTKLLLISKQQLYPKEDVKLNEFTSTEEN